MTPKPVPKKGYQCQDCSYCSEKGFPGGCCPGCGSFNIKRLNSPDESHAPPARRNFRLALMVAVWAYMIYRIWDTWQQLH